MKNKHYGVVLVTVNNQKEAESIAKTLVEESLAACVNFMPITSVYRWQGEVCCDSEWQLIIKTDLKLFPRLENRIRELHSYDVPEMIALPIIKGSQPYLDWVQQNVINF
ncbi:divalent-cation tolerance protein CutA [Geminocystis sp. NIES-3709]|uniref:divalent-cation tolerance protein CutA n=1 Tax=Geminocystis sp. NIES-3709 TaxID=1617448 RepID=UPI0005FCBA1F|nr:divalent-cation tolerance protein CutA [Geminocystis sp. NIES-3709]BAQ65272.1 periplasmic divalent cation tolerance protein cutA [Geminocystis sp. NIES-3709]